MCAQRLVGLNYAYLTPITDPALKPGFYIISPKFSTQIEVFLPIEGHIMA